MLVRSVPYPARRACTGGCLNLPLTLTPNPYSRRACSGGCRSASCGARRPCASPPTSSSRAARGSPPTTLTLTPALALARALALAITLPLPLPPTRLASEPTLALPLPLTRFASEPYLSYFDALDATGGFYTHRWGDACVHMLAVSALLPRHAVLRLRTVPYWHQGDRATARCRGLGLGLALAPYLPISPPRHRAAAG